MKFIHFTDPHLVRPGRTLYGLDLQGQLEACVASINESHGDAEFCLVTGDLTHYGEPGAYGLLKQSLARLAIPCHMIVGNHDEREAFLAAFPETPVDVNGYVQYVVESSAGRFVMLDTLIAGTHAGELGPARLAWVRTRLEEAGDEPVFLVLHHAPMATRIKAVDRIGLNDAEALWEVVRDFANIRHIFFGHIHRQVHGSWRGIPFSTLKATGWQLRLTFEADDIGGVHDGPSYAVVFVDDDAVVIHDYGYMSEDDVFEYVRLKPEDLPKLER